jgi:alpha-aminoadipate carrier protein LysW
MYSQGYTMAASAKGGTGSLECPECGGEVGLPDDVEVDEVIWCFSCGVELRVLALDPAAVELVDA